MSLYLSQIFIKISTKQNTINVMEGLDKVIQELLPKNAIRKLLLFLNEQAIDSLATEIGGSIYLHTYFKEKTK